MKRTGVSGKKSGFSNLTYKIVALLIAVVLWFYVSDLHNPVMERTLAVDVRYTNLSEELVLSEKEKTVNVVVQGEKKKIDSIDAGSFVATVDLKNMGLGEMVHNVVVTGLADVDIVRVSPREIKVVADKMSSKQLSIQTFLYGEVQPGYKSYRPEVVPSQVIIKGSERQLKDISAAIIDVNLNFASENIKLNLPIKVQDSLNNWYGLETFTLIPETAEVYVPVRKDMPEKTVTVKPIFNGEPSTDMVVSRVVLEPEVVKILGEYSELEKIDVIQTLPIDIAGINEDVTRDVALEIPEEVSLLYGTQVKITVQVKEKPVIKNFKLGVAVVNPVTGMKTTLNPAEVTIRVSGEKDAVYNLLTSHFIASVDVAGLGEGDFEPTVQVSGPKNIEIQQIYPTRVKASIKKIEKPDDKPDDTPEEPEEPGDSKNTDKKAGSR